MPCGTAPFPGLSEGRIRAAKGSHRGLGARHALLASPSCLAAFLRPLSSSLAQLLLYFVLHVASKSCCRLFRLRRASVAAPFLRAFFVPRLFIFYSRARLPTAVLNIFPHSFFSTGPRESCGAAGSLAVKRINGR